MFPGCLGKNTLDWIGEEAEGIKRAQLCRTELYRIKHTTQIFLTYFASKGHNFMDNTPLDRPANRSSVLNSSIAEWLHGQSSDNE